MLLGLGDLPSIVEVDLSTDNLGTEDKSWWWGQKDTMIRMFNVLLIGLLGLKNKLGW